MDGIPEGVRQVIDPLKKLVRRLEERMNLQAVVLFGSRARSENLVDSDVDVLVISDDFEGLPRWERGYRILCEWEHHLPLEPIGMTSQEFRKCYGLLHWDILEDGIVLKDEGIFSKVKDLFERMKIEKLIERTESGWRFDAEGISKRISE